MWITVSEISELTNPELWWNCNGPTLLSTNDEAENINKGYIIDEVNTELRCKCQTIVTLTSKEQAETQATVLGITGGNMVSHSQILFKSRFRERWLQRRSMQQNYIGLKWPAEIWTHLEKVKILGSEPKPPILCGRQIKTFSFSLDIQIQMIMHSGDSNTQVQLKESFRLSQGDN